MSQPLLSSVFSAVLIVCAAVPAQARDTSADKHWLSSWGTSLMVPDQNNELAAEHWVDGTLRQIVPMSVDGKRLRVRFSNLYGTAPMTIRSAGVGLAVKPGTPSIQAGSSRSLSFSGRPSVTIPAGTEYYSDPVELAHKARADLAVSFHVTETPSKQTGHPGARTHSFYVKGDRVLEAEWVDAAKTTRWYQVADIEVEASRKLGALVAMGDSITDGYGVQPDTNERWTDHFSRRLLAAGTQMAVINGGIGGGRLLRDGLGPNLMSRFDREVLGRSGVTHAMVLIGVNDLGVQHRNKEDSVQARKALLDELMDGHRQLVTRAHAHGICVIGATVGPYVGSEYYNPGPENEADRQALNHWIRTAKVFDAVADVDAALRDPARPDRLLAALDSGDHLHPSTAGYKAIADAIPLSAVRSCAYARCRLPMTTRRRILAAAGLLAMLGAQAAPQTYSNPVIKGFHPDPSICRVGDDYYLATSSFEYYPGVPLFHSRDLVNWRQIGHALTRPSQLDLQGLRSSQGIYAPTLRCHAGTFYMITTNVGKEGNFYVHTRDPAGEWSEPVKIREGADAGIDPSLLFDDDGKVYFTRHGGGERGGVVQAEIDIATGKLLAAPRRIWNGTGGVWPEGPHLYKVDGWYHLLISEGGTSYDHMLTMARSRTPWGPFEPAPHNPVFTHRDKPSLPLQAIGHGDIVQAPDGQWWMVMLGVRAQGSGGARTHHIGRETLLAPVAWDENGWLTVNGGQPLSETMTVDGLPPAQPWPATPVRDDFNAARLGFAWNTLRGPATGLWSLSEKPGTLRLKGTPGTLADIGTPAFVGRRQEHLRMRASTEMHFTPTASGQSAGLALRMNEAHHTTLLVTSDAKKGRRVELVSRVGGVRKVLASRRIGDGAVTLQIDASPERYDYSAKVGKGVGKGVNKDAGKDAFIQLGSTPTADLSSETAGGFTGVYVGMVASGDKPMPAADFSWFDYQPLGK